MNEIKFHMLMLMNEWVMLMLMQMQVQSASLTLGCYTLVFQLWLVSVLDQESYGALTIT